MDNIKEENLERGLTDEQRYEYLNNYGMFCPFCDSSDLYKIRAFTEDHSKTWIVTCGTCGRKWTELHIIQLSDIYVEDSYDEREEGTN